MTPPELDQERLEREGIGYRCRSCGCTVFATTPKEPSEMLCSACRKRPVRRLRHPARKIKII